MFRFLVQVTLIYERKKALQRFCRDRACLVAVCGVCGVFARHCVWVNSPISCVCSGRVIELRHTITDPLTPAAAADPDKSEKSTYVRPCCDHGERDLYNLVLTHTSAGISDQSYKSPPPHVWRVQNVALTSSVWSRSRVIHMWRHALSRLRKQTNGSF